MCSYAGDAQCRTVDAPEAAARTEAPVSLVDDVEPVAAALDCGPGAEAGREARAQGALSGAVRDSRLMGEVRRQCARGAGVRALLDRTTGEHAHRRQSDPGLQAAGTAQVARAGRWSKSG